MTFLCLLYYDVSAFAGLTPDDLAALAAECQPLDRALHASGHLRTVATLEHEVARTLRPRAGVATPGEGHLLARDEQVGAYLVIEAADLDEAVRVASLHPAAQTGETLGWAVDVRPIDFLIEPPRERSAGPARFLCLGFYDPAALAALPPDQLEALPAACRPHDEALGRTGQLVVGASLGGEARTIRKRRGKIEITDGPFIEAKEMIGSFLVLEAADLDEAMRIASIHPAAHMGEDLGWALEVRPIEAALNLPAPS
jgi:hypothetical protein